MTTIGEFTFFWNGELSQWERCIFRDNLGTEYNSAEQYMFARKAILFNDSETYKKIMESDSPREQKNLGRIVQNFDQKIWDANKVGIVTIGNILKFSQNEDLKKILFSTRGTTLVEASPYDKIWGIGLGEGDPRIIDRNKWRGENLLGYILSNIRDFHLF